MRRQTVVEEIVCDKCGKTIDKFYLKNKDGKDYHPNCYNELFTACDDCYEELPNDEIIYDEISDRGLCKECVKDRYKHYKNLIERF